jgi:hypothetical protein
VPASETESGWAAVVINYEAGEALRDCVRSLLDDTSTGRAQRQDPYGDNGPPAQLRKVAHRVPPFAPDRPGSES